MLLVLAAGGGAKTRIVAPGLIRPVISHVDQHWGGRNAPREIVSVTDDGLRVIVHRADRSRNEFYDWSTDPEEQNNRSDEDSPRLRSMVERADQYLRDSSPPWGVESPTIELDEMRLNQLRALGYRVDR